MWNNGAFLNRFPWNVENYNDRCTFFRRVELTEGRVSPHVKLAELTVYDVPSVEHDGQTLGSVSFSESFLDSTVSVIRPGEGFDLIWF